MPLVTCPDCSRQISDIAPTCPSCGRPNAAPSYPTQATPQVIAPDPMQAKVSPKAVAVVLGAIVVGLGIYGFQSLRAAPVMTGRPIDSSAAPASPAPQPTEDPNPPRTELLRMDGMSATDAFAVVRPSMADVYKDDSVGAALFALWGARRMRWSDVYVEADETTFAKVRKDSSEEIGKGMCSPGQIIEIHAEKPESGGHVAHGLLNSDSDHLYHFIAAGSSGNIGEDSRATLCGFVVGNYDYPNSAGGTGHAVAIVGMFDLPENRQAGR